jgi:nicotinate phosphoribosyltransferase
MIIESLLDTDLYKFTMMQVVLHQFPSNMVEYTFKCRSQGFDYVPLVDEIREEIHALCQLRFTVEELAYLRSLRFIKNDFVDFLRIFQLNEDFVSIDTEPEFQLRVRGPWLHTIMFEVPLLAIICEVYERNHHPQPDYAAGRQRLAEKIEVIRHTEPEGGFKFSDFGTRRRFSRQWQQEVIATLQQQLPQNFIGTSNMMFAKQMDLRPIGTMAHEYIQACQASGPRLVDSQKFAFSKWAEEYRGDLGIALTDTYGLEPFLHDFDMFFCKLFDGVRQDSGDPFEWGDRIIQHYQENRVDPKTKSIVFSDTLDMHLAVKIYNYFKQRTNPSFGIGTHLTNDLGYAAPQNVIKMTECNGQPVAKISSSPEKLICKDMSYLAYLKKVFNISD